VRVSSIVVPRPAFVGGPEMTAKRDYGQFCGLAAGLNILGERWTLLIIRELLIDTARFSELLESLRGIGPNLLTARLLLPAHGPRRGTAPAGARARPLGHAVPARA
jgi:HxlR-like helix-turn-helix protein